MQRFFVSAVIGTFMFAITLNTLNRTSNAVFASSVFSMLFCYNVGMRCCKTFLQNIMLCSCIEYSILSAGENRDMPPSSFRKVDFCEPCRKQTHSPAPTLRDPSLTYFIMAIFVYHRMNSLAYMFKIDAD